MAHFDDALWPGPQDNPGPEEAILEQALALPASERAAFLDRACGNDAPLRQLVEGLLRAHCYAADSRESPRAQSPTLPPEFPVKPTAGAFEQSGDRIGQYKLLQQVG